MDFLVIIIIVTLVSLVTSLVYVFMSYPNPNITIPHAMTNCPDKWEMDENGKCVIPCPDLSGANVGDLGKKKTTLYKYTIIEDEKTQKIVNKISSMPSWTLNGKEIFGKLYKNDQKMQIYAYDLKNDLPTSIYNPLIEDEHTYIETPNVIDFTSPYWTKFNNSPSSRICNIKKWLHKHNIQWDGVSQYNRCNNAFQKDESILIPTAEQTEITEKKYKYTNSNMYGSKADIYFSYEKPDIITKNINTNSSGGGGSGGSGGGPQ